MTGDMEFGTYYETIGYELRGALSRYYDTWLEVLSRDRKERALYLNTVEQRRISVVVLTCALLEHNISFYLSAKCDAARFDDLQWESLVNKWTTVPKEFVPAYDLSPGSTLLRDLKTVVGRRNKIVHARPMLSIEGGHRHSGNEPRTALNENLFMERCATLPYCLLENLLKFDPDTFITMSSVSTSAASVARELNGARFRFSYITQIPEALLTEIMSQGHSRDRAKLIAALIGPVPRWRPDKSIVVRRNGCILTILRPLKFFEGGSFVLDPGEL
jgi:hypothetical protein